MEGTPAYPTEPRYGWATNCQAHLTPDQVKRLRLTALSAFGFGSLHIAGLMTLWSTAIDHAEQDLGTFGATSWHGPMVGALVASWLGFLTVSASMFARGLPYLRIIKEAKRGSVLQTEATLEWRGRRYVADAGGVRLKLWPNLASTLLPGRYRLSYLPRTRVVTSTQWLGKPLLYGESLRQAMASAGFPASALPFNRVGRRSPEQLDIRSLPGIGFVFALFVVAAIAEWSVGAPLDALTHAMLPLFLGVSLLLLGNLRPFTDLRPGSVARADGHVSRVARQTDNGTWRSTLAVADHTFRVPKAVYDALDEQYVYRLYYSVRGHRLLNIEPIGERTSGPADAT